MTNMGLNFAGIMDELPLPVLVVTSNGSGIKWANTQSELLFGRSRNALIDKGLAHYTLDDDNLPMRLKSCFDTQTSARMDDIAFRVSGGGFKSLQLEAFPHEGDIVVTLRIETHRDVEPDPGDGGAVSALGRMLAHELKNPLAGIKGAAQLLRYDASSDEDKELIELISTETDRIRRLVDRMESFGQFDDLEIQPVNIHSVLRQARLLTESSGSARVTFKERYDPSLPPIAGDKDALMQVAINLIVNAAEAFASGDTQGEITLETAYRSGLRRRNENGQTSLPIEIKIRDNGPGIPERLRHQIFMPFVTDKPAGRGLGLTLVSRIVKAHGGIIDVESVPGSTVFTLHLPSV